MIPHQTHEGQNNTPTMKIRRAKYKCRAPARAPHSSRSQRSGSAKKRPRGDDIGKVGKLAIKDLSKTSLPKSVLHAMAIYGRMIGSWFLLIALYNISSVAAAIGLVPVLIWTAANMRGLENLVHDAAHFNWARKRQKLNDVVAGLLVATPVFQSIAAYRKSHMFHHQNFDTFSDPCRNRSAMVRHIVIARVARLKKYLPRLFSLNREYYEALFSGTNRWLPLWFVVWHATVFIFPAWLITGHILLALGLWLLFWVVPFVLVLPVIRAVAESEEHAYFDTGTEVEITYTHTDLVGRWVVHQAGDAYHAAHHLACTVPAYRMARLHAVLKEHSRNYLKSLERRV
jgi:fatty acid desaturase